MKRDKHNIVVGKMDYSRGKRPPVECILCAVAADDPRVERLVVFRHRLHFVTLNLYPYNPGHVMVVPVEHYEDPRELNEAEAWELHVLQGLCMEVLESEYHPHGFNLGYNVGHGSGASIPHLHLQVVPRYRTELGFFDILSDSRVIVEEPQVTQERLSKAFRRVAPGYLEGRAGPAL